MSGVFGIVDSGRQSDVERLLVAMGGAMTHRDWYVVETVADARRGLGLGRIGIGIFNREQQPVCSEDRDLMVFLSGEFYNSADLRRAAVDRFVEMGLGVMLTRAASYPAESE